MYMQYIKQNTHIEFIRMQKKKAKETIVTFKPLTDNAMTTCSMRV